MDFFDQIRKEVLEFSWRPGVQVSEIPAPQALAERSFAIEASVFENGEDEIASAKLILLYDSVFNPTWQGCFRCVSLVEADAELAIVHDPLLPEVGWSWLLDGLNDAGADFHDESGTVTCQASQGFGELAEREDQASVEIRASWTAEIDDPSQIGAHLSAWQNVICNTAGLPPLPTDIAVLKNRIEAS